jgi:hypothetical protein
VRAQRQIHVLDGRVVDVDAPFAFSVNCEAVNASV